MGSAIGMLSDCYRKEGVEKAILYILEVNIWILCIED